MSDPRPDSKSSTALVPPRRRRRRRPRQPAFGRYYHGLAIGAVATAAAVLVLTARHQAAGEPDPVWRSLFDIIVVQLFYMPPLFLVLGLSRRWAAAWGVATVFALVWALLIPPIAAVACALL